MPTGINIPSPDLPSKRVVIKNLLASRRAKLALSVAGAVLVGAIGSGIWQELLGPAMRAAGLGLLNVISLLFGSFRAGVYEQIARDNPSLGGMEAFSLLGFSLSLSLGYGAGMVAGWWRDLRKIQTAPDDPSKAPTLGSVRFSLYALSALLTVASVAHLINMAKVSYINSAISNYHQTLRVALPYIGEQERLVLDSQFAQIKTRQDYLSILERLDKVAADHGQNVPHFTAW